MIDKDKIRLGLLVVKIRVKVKGLQDKGRVFVYAAAPPFLLATQRECSSQTICSEFTIGK